MDEFRVVTTGTNADTGRSSGAQVNILTRSGSNALHGTLYEYNRNTFLTANNWFNKQAQVAAGLPNKPGKLIRNTFGAALGGPVRRDKLFFFGNYEGQRTAENTQQTLTVPSAAFRSGSIGYLSGEQAVSLTPAQFASMDPRCSAAGTCPLGPGANPAVLAVLQQYPLPNGSTRGDGLNSGSYTFSAPSPASLNTGIVRLDWNLSPRNQLFVRANLQDDTTSFAPQFQGGPPSYRLRDNTKGIAAGWTFTATPTLVNNLRYGFIRQGYGQRGIGQGSFVDFDALSSLNAETRSTLRFVPVHNIVDDLTWTHGAHTFQIGINDRLVHNQLSTDANSYDSAGTIGFDVTGSGFAGTGQSFDPAVFHLDPVNGQVLPDGKIFHPEKPSFTTSYNSAVADLAGIVSQVTNQYNYAVNRAGTAGTLDPQGAFVSRDFKSNEFEYYLQDTWRATPRLTLTVGLRHLLAQTPFEVNGQQAQPTVDVDQWFRARAANAAAGIPDTTPLSFAPSGQARGFKPFYPMQRANLAPRFALAYAVNDRTSLRAGFGMVYDHFGQAVVNTFAQFGAYGLQGFQQTPNDRFSPDNAARFSSLNTIPAVNGPVAPSVSYPFTPSTDPTATGFATAVGLDDHLKTPYSYTLDLSVQRQLPAGFTLETAYVGRLGRHLLEQTDLAAPADFVDPASGTDFYTAARELTVAAYNNAVSVAPVPYFEHLFPDAARAGISATQNIYQNLFVNYPTNASFIQYTLDSLDHQCSPGCGGNPTEAQGRFYNPQFNSLFSWTSNGTSNYNALQLILRHPLTHGLQVDASYTLSKSLDLGSNSERTCLQCGSTRSSTFSWIVNAFDPRQNYGPSDFDTRHIVTANWLYLLPFGQGQAFGAHTGSALNTLIGGWQLSGIARWTSGLPFTAINGTGWEVDWSKQSALVVNGNVHDGTRRTHTHLGPGGAPQAFSNPDALLASLGTLTGSVRNALPGESGSRNAFRGDGYFGIDAGLSKFVTIHDQQRLRLTWEVFNVTNSVRFDVNPLNSLQNQAGIGGFGNYGATLTQPRVQQLAARFSF